MKKVLLKILFAIQKITSLEILQIKAIKSLGMVKPLFLIDVGSAKGMPNRWKKIESVIFKYGFEPDEGARKKLKQSPDLRGGGNLDFPFALSDKAEQIVLNVLKKPSHSSVLIPNNDFTNLFPKRHPDGFEINFQANVEGIDLDTLEFEAKDFMKIDVQGYELKVLKGSETSLRDILGLEIEIGFSELYKNQCSFGEIKDYMSENAFEFIDFTSLTRWERDASKNTLGLCVGGDALFLRTPEFIYSKYQNDKEKLAAYLSICLIYKRHDYISKTFELFNIEKDIHYLEFLRINKKLRRRLNFADRLSRLSNHIIRFFVSEVDSTPMFY
jgi:FkbM family methyltransferase